jgi:proline iminopeptidase
MSDLYPPIRPYATHRLDVDDGHNLYVEECGQPQGLPIVCLHGGPGGYCSPTYRRFFDPDTTRAVLYDQRGCGRSRARHDLVRNTTDHLVADLERIRAHLHIPRWVVFGGSWGATLALAYAEAYPDRVQALILRAPFLGRREDLDWLYRDGANRIYPDHWARFVQGLSTPERADVITAFHRRLTGADEVARMAAAKAWASWEARLSTVQSSLGSEPFGEPHAALRLARIESHYFVNRCFLEPNQLLQGIGRVRPIPGIIVHGRFDAVCPPTQGWALAEAWPAGELRIQPDSGHAISEPGIQRALLEATREIVQRLS